LQGGDRSLDLVRIDYLDGDHHGSGVHHVIAHEARSVSLFGGRRVVTVVHADTLTYGAEAAGDEVRKTKSRSKKATGADALEVLADSMAAFTGKPPFVLIFVAEHFDRRKRAWKVLSALGGVVDVAPMTVATLQAYLVGEAAAFAIRVDELAGQRIWDRLGGTDAARLRQTADRLILDAGPRGALTVAMIEASVPMDRDAASWAITDAIAEEDVTRAITVLHLLLDHVTPTEHAGEIIRILGFFTSQYAAMAQVASGWARGMGDDEIAHGLGMHPFRLKNIARQLRTMRAGRLEQALGALDAADQVLKSTAIGDRKVATTRWMEQLVIALARGTSLRLRPAPKLLGAL